MTQERTPVPRKWLYSPDCPQGKVFEGADAIAAAEADGWVDNPGLTAGADDANGDGGGDDTPPAKPDAKSAPKAAAKKVAPKKVAPGDDSS